MRLHQPRYFPGETLFVRVLYRPFFTPEKPSMAFSGWGGPSVQLGFMPEKGTQKLIKPAVALVVTAGFFVLEQFVAGGRFWHRCAPE